MQSLLRDLRYATRQLCKSPGFTITVILTLALGIGATTSIFSCVYGLLIKSLPFQDERSIITLSETNSQVKGASEATYLDYLDWRNQQTSFSQVAAYSTVNPSSVSLVIDGKPAQIQRVLASGNFFSLLGVSPVAGRLFDNQDDITGKNNVAVISASAWQTYFGRDRSTIGRSISLNGTSYTVIGVLPSNASFPAEGEVWLPLSLLDQPTRASRVWHSVKVLGRLRPGVSLSAARSDMQTVAQRLSAAYPATNRNEGIALDPLHDNLVSTLRPAMLCLMGAVVLVLIVACVNVANLLLVRATESRRDVAVRKALGANRQHLFRQYLAQTLMLSLLGGSLGILLASIALPLLRVALTHTEGFDESLLHSISLNFPVLLFTLAVCTLTAFLFGLLPAARTSAPLVDILRSGDRSSSHNHRGRAILVTTEIAIAVVVVFLSTLVVRSFQKLIAIDPGLRTDHILTAEITLPTPRYGDSSPLTNRFYEQVLENIVQSHGVLSAATTTQVPLRPSQVMTRFLIEGAPALAPGTFPYAQIRFISPDYFRAMGIGLLKGRTFTRSDIDSTTGFFVVNESFARHYLSSRDPIGANILIGVMSPTPSKIPVVGVVSNARDLGIDSDPEPEIYLPGYGLHAVLLVRTTLSSDDAATMVRNAVRAADPAQPVYHIETIDAVLADSVARQRMTATLLGSFALITLVLAAIGSFGVLSYSVAQRTREIGVRMAIGANRGDILQLILRQAAGSMGIGIFAGLVAGFLAARLINGLLFQTNITDPLSLAISISALVLVTVLAATIPALRAASVNPVDALRSE
ncbi:ABC transporter permease [Telmatobacter sp. DSM 110680]|uniref:ABC transporter permease n=1 Tax=Telmatobacter sp. DSM 110680 TaxID=3036704 RepID=A0AAU7DHP0_9BACT